MFQVDPGSKTLSEHDVQNLINEYYAKHIMIFLYYSDKLEKYHASLILCPQFFFKFLKSGRTTSFFCVYCVNLVARAQFVYHLKICKFNNVKKQTILMPEPREVKPGIFEDPLFTYLPTTQPCRLSYHGSADLEASFSRFHMAEGGNEVGTDDEEDENNDDDGRTDGKTESGASKTKPGGSRRKRARLTAQMAQVVSAITTPIVPSDNERVRELKSKILVTPRRVGAGTCIMEMIKDIFYHGIHNMYSLREIEFYYHKLGKICAQDKLRLRMAKKCEYCGSNFASNRDKHMHHSHSGNPSYTLSPQVIEMYRQRAIAEGRISRTDKYDIDQDSTYQKFEIACSACNNQRKSDKRRFHVYFHNLFRFDLKLILEELFGGSCPGRNLLRNVHCILANTETIKSFSFEMYCYLCHGDDDDNHGDDNDDKNDGRSSATDGTKDHHGQTDGQGDENGR